MTHPREGDDDAANACEARPGGLGGEAVPVGVSPHAAAIEDLRHRATELAADTAEAQAAVNGSAADAYRAGDRHTAAVHSVTAHELAEAGSTLGQAFESYTRALTAATQANPEPTPDSEPGPALPGLEHGQDPGTDASSASDTGGGA